MVNFDESSVFILICNAYTTKIQIVNMILIISKNHSSFTLVVDPSFDNYGKRKGKLKDCKPNRYSAGMLLN